jgi:hypothetical protein
MGAAVPDMDLPFIQIRTLISTVKVRMYLHFIFER